MARKLLLVLLLGFLAAILGNVNAGGEKPADNAIVLPEDVRHVPSDALGFVHFRVGDFLVSDLGRAFLKELSKNNDLAGVSAELEKQLGLGLADVESCTLIVLAPAPGPDKRFGAPGFGRPDDRHWQKGVPKSAVPKAFPDKEANPFDGFFKDKEPEKRRLEEPKKPIGDPPPDMDFSPVAFLSPPQHGDFLDMDAFEFGMSPESLVGVVITSKKAVDRKKMLRAQLGDPREERHRGEGWTMLFLSDRSFLVAYPPMLLRYADAQRRDNPPTPLRGAKELAAEKHLVSGGGHVPDSLKRLFLMEVRHVPPQIATIYPLVNVRSAAFAMDMIEDKANLSIRLFGNERSTALAVEAVKTGLAWLDVGFDRLHAGIELAKMSKATEAFVKKARQALAETKIEQKGNTAQVQLAMEVDAATLHAALAELGLKLQTSAARTQSQNNLKQIALAMHSHHDVYKGFPPPAIGGIKDDDGKSKPLLSWRVAILPFIEQDQLYKEFKLDEPWDSPNNKKLIAQMPAIYAMPGAEKQQPGMTHYQVFVGPGTVFELIKEGKANVRIPQITDGTSNTLMVVEASAPVIWTKPEDLPFDPKGALPKLGGVFPDGFNAAFCDGSVQFLRGKMNPATLRGLITRNGGEIVELDN